jgi:hypothetical protein
MLHGRRDTPLKKTVLLAAISALAILIVLPVICFVNDTASNSAITPGTLTVDGWPIPPLPPPAVSGEAGMLVADGWPIPPLPPGGLQTLSIA